MSGPGQRGGDTVTHPQRTVVEQQHQRVLKLYQLLGDNSYVDVADMTGYTVDYVRTIVKTHLATMSSAELDSLRALLWADLEELKRSLDMSLYPTRLPDGSKLPAGLGRIPVTKDDVASLVKIVHEQALLVGAHAPKQVAVTHGIEENPTAEAFADDVERFAELADKIARSGYGSGLSEISEDDAAKIIDADIVPSPRPPLLDEVENAASTTNGNGHHSPVNL